MATFIAPGQGGYNGPRMAGAPIVQASADSFGAASGRDLEKYGRLGLNAGLDVLAAAQEQQRKCDTAVAKDKVNQARIEMLEGADKIQQEQGANAQNARSEMNSLFDSVNKKYGSEISGGNVELQDMYNQSMQGMRRTYDLAGARKQVREMRQYEEATYVQGNAVEDAEIDAIFSGNSPLSGDGTNEVLVDTQGQVLPPINPGEEMAKRIMMRRENIAMRLSGSPAGYIKQMQDDEEVRMHGIAVNTLSKNNPRAALEYLNMPEVKAIVPSKEWTKANDWLKGVVETADIAEDAMASVDVMSGADILRKAYNDPRYKGNEKARKQFLSITKSISMEREALAKAEQAGYKQKLWDAFEESNYKTIPPEAIKDWGIYEGMIDAQAKIGKFLGQDKKPIANENELITLYNKTPEEKAEFLMDGLNYRDFLMWTAGDTAWRSAILGGLNGADKAGKDGEGAGAGRNGVYAGANVKDLFEADFPSFSYTNTEKGWLWDTETSVGGVDYDSRNPEHKRLLSNALYHFRNRWNDPELYKDLKPEDRREAIRFDIISEYRDQKIDLDSTIYDSYMAERLQDQIDNPVIESVNQETGATEVTMFDKDSEEVKTFEKVDVETLQGIVPGVNVSQGFRVPDAMESGTYKGVNYQPGDTILVVSDKLYGMNDSIFVLDSELNLRPESVSIGLVTPQPEPMYAYPPKTDQMLAWEKKKGATFEWQKYAGRYIAKVEGDSKGIMSMYYEANADGNIYYLGTSSEVEEHLLADNISPSSERIKELEEKIAISERDPRTRKDVEEDMRQEVKRLKSIMESDFYVG